VNPLDEHTLLSLVVEAMLLLAIFLVILIFHTLNLYVRRSKVFEILQVVGALMVAGGMLTLRTTRIIFSSPINALFIVLFPFVGSLLIILPFLICGYLKIDKESALQIFLLLLSSVIYSFVPLHPIGRIVATLSAFALLSIILLMKLLPSLTTCTRFNRNLVRLASWFLVLHAWLRYYVFKNPQTCIYYGVLLVYFTSLLMWVYSTLRTYEIMRGWF